MSDWISVEDRLPEENEAVKAVKGKPHYDKFRNQHKKKGFRK
tara:strand:+ start:201 stop:326 length:126 start_codon:yes stop_codon:yes gene_type:complete